MTASIEARRQAILTALDNASGWIQAEPGHRHTFPPPARELIMSARLSVARYGREQLDEFTKWLIESEGVTANTAEVYANHVWQSIVVTGGAPARQLERHDLTAASKNTIRSALKHFAAYSRDAELAAAVTHKKITKLLRDRRNSAPSKLVTPISPDMLDKLMGVMLADKGNPRRPWAWPALSLMVKLGLRAGADLALGVTHDAVSDALKEGAPLVVIGKRGKRRVVPSSVVHEELEMLASFPYAWHTLADLIAPAAPPKTRANTAYSRIRTTLKEYALRAGIDPAEIHTHRLRHTAALRLYEASGHDIMLVAAFLGHSSIETTRNYLHRDRTDEMNGHLEAMWED